MQDYKSLCAAATICATNGVCRILSWRQLSKPIGPRCEAGRAESGGGVAATQQFPIYQMHLMASSAVF